MGQLCGSYNKEASEFEIVIKRVVVSLRELQKLLQKGYYLEDLPQPLRQALKEFKTVENYFKPYLSDDIRRQLFIEDFLQSENNYLKQENSKLKSRYAELQAKSNQRQNPETVDQIKRVSEYEERIQAQNRLIEKQNNIVYEIQCNQEQLQKRCQELQAEIDESRQKESKMRKQLEKAHNEQEKLIISLTKGGANMNSLYATPFQSFTELEEECKPRQQRPVRRSPTNYDPFHIGENLDFMDVDENQEGLTNEIQKEIGQHHLIEKMKQSYAKLECRNTELQQQLQERECLIIDLQKRLNNQDLTLVNERSLIENLKNRLTTVQNNYQQLMEQNQKQSNIIQNLQQQIESCKKGITILQQSNKVLEETNLLKDSTTTTTPLPSTSCSNVETQEEIAIKQIERITEDINHISEQLYKYENSLPNQDYLHFQELLIRSMLQLDNIESYGNQTIRSHRLMAMQIAQGVMNVLESKPTS